MRTARWRPRTILTAVLIIILFACTTEAIPPIPTPAHHPGPPANAPLAVVALGDSTISGEGVGDYVQGTNGQNGDWCHRSANAEINEIHLPGVTKAVNLACSGADAADVELGSAVHYTETSQAARLAVLARHDRVTAILVGVGANDDPQFANTLDACVQAWFDSALNKNGCSTDFTGVWQTRVNAMIPKVAAVLHDIRTVMTGAGYPDGSYQIVLQSYAAPLGPDVAPSLQNLNGCPLRTSDLQWIRNTGVTLLDAGLRKAADQADVRFLDLARAGVGHEACSDPQNPANEWFTRLTVAWQDLKDNAASSHALQESFHPNARGHAAFASCLSDFLNTTESAAACLPDSAGTLHPAALLGPG
jgi:lysophospholipase L1-like esterase